MHESLRLALIRSFQPLVRFAMLRGLKIQDLTEILKSAFIAAARNEIGQNEDKVNVSKLAVITGLHRRDVMRLATEGYSIKKETTLLTKVIGLWATAKRYKNPSGKVRALAFAGPGNEFVKLCETVSKDLNAYTVLYELERLQIVEKKGDMLYLRKRALLPDPSSNEALELLADDLNDLCACVDQNSGMAEDAPNLHVKTYFDNIPPAKIPSLRAWLLAEGSKFHDTVRAYLGKHDRDVTGQKDTGDGRSRIAFASFSCVEEDNQKKNT